VKLVSSGSIKVKDGAGNVWDVVQEDVKPRRTRYSDYQGGDILKDELSATTPNGTVLLIPPFEQWKPDVVFDGTLTHPAGSLRWD